MFGKYKKKLDTSTVPEKPVSKCEQEILSLLEQKKTHGFIVNHLLEEGYSMEEINESYTNLSFDHPGKRF